jgi:hypothetical protein
MDDKDRQFEEEIEDLRQELENFQQEKDRIRGIVGKIGGIPTFNTKLFNNIFLIVIIISLVVSLFFPSESIKLLMIELATAALSVKILYMMHCQNRVNHFQLWMLSSLEWRINEVMKQLRKFQDDD